MVEIKWTQFYAPRQDGEYLALVSYLPLTSFWKSFAFLRLAREIQAQLARSRGVLGYSLRFFFLSKKGYTLSVWEGEESLNAFVQTAPHSTVMKTLRRHMRTPKFVTWKVTAAEMPPGWPEALSRLQTG